jgi:hypothetical protein
MLGRPRERRRGAVHRAVDLARLEAEMDFVGVLLTVALIPVLLGRIRAEEALLLSHFGAEYEPYRARTWRLLPGIY